jgi:excisionase family DNA binding protein
MTINEVAAALRVHRNTLNRWRRAGTSPPEFRLPNGSLRFTRDQVLAWLDQQGMGR